MSFFTNKQYFFFEYFCFIYNQYITYKVFYFKCVVITELRRWRDFVGKKGPFAVSYSFSN